MRYCLILLLGIVLLASCESTTSEPPEPRGGVADAAFRLAPEDAGGLHNRICVAYAERREELGDRPITRKEFVQLMADAVNESFADEGLPATVTTRDVNRVIAEILALRERGVFDFFSDQPGTSGAIVDDWETRGIISRKEADVVRTQFSGDNIDTSSWKLEAFASVYESSMSLWTDPTFTRNIAFLPQAQQNLDFGDEYPPDKSRLVYEMDSLGGLLGWYFGGGGGSLLGAAIFSWSIYECPPAELEHWECSDYDCMA